MVLTVWKRDMGEAPADTFLAITCYFNPVGYQPPAPEARVFPPVAPPQLPALAVGAALN